METRAVHIGHYLFKVGDPDDSIYVVQTGEITVSIREPASIMYYVISDEKKHIVSIIYVYFMK